MYYNKQATLVPLFFFAALDATVDTKVTYKSIPATTWMRYRDSGISIFKFAGSHAK